MKKLFTFYLILFTPMIFSQWPQNSSVPLLLLNSSNFIESNEHDKGINKNIYLKEDKSVDSGIYKISLFGGLGLAQFNTLLTSIDLNFKLVGLLFLNLGADVYGDKHGNGVVVNLNAIPEFGVSISNFEMMFGFGGAIMFGSGSGGGGVGAAFLPSYKLNYRIDEKYGIGLEIKQPTDFRSGTFLTTLGISIKL